MSAPTLETMARDGALGPQWAVGKEELETMREDDHRRATRACDRREAATKYGLTVARAVKAQIQWGPQPCTDGVTITALDPGSGDDSGRAWWQYEASLATIDHEAAHVRHTLTSQRFASSRAVWMQRIQDIADKLGRTHALAEHVRGFVEDIRIETLWLRDHPGAAGPLRLAVGSISNREGYKPPPEIVPVAAMYARHVGLTARPDWCTREQWEAAAPLARKVQARALTGPHGPEGSMAPAMLKLVEEILASLPEGDGKAQEPEPQPEPQASPSPDGEGEQEGEQEQGEPQPRKPQDAKQDEGEADEGDEPEDATGDEEAGQDDDQEAEPGDEDSDGEQGGEGEPEAEAWTPPEWHPLAAGAWWLAQQPPEKSTVARLDAPQPWQTLKPDRIIHGNQSRNVAKGREAAELRDGIEHARRAAGTGEITALISKIRSLDKARWRGDLSSGRPDPRRLAQMAADLTANACRQRSVAHAPKVGLACAIDASGSMGTGSTISSQGCALALVEAVRRCGGVAAMGAFAYEALGAGERPLASKCRPIVSGGGTPLHEAVDGAHASIMRGAGRDCHIRLAVILSDGEAESPSLCRKAAKRCRAAGIQVLGVFLTGGRRASLDPLLELACAQLHEERGYAYSHDEALARAQALRADPFAQKRAEAAWSVKQAQFLSASLDGAPACAIRGPADLARAVAPAIRALLAQWEGGRP